VKGIGLVQPVALVLDPETRRLRGVEMRPLLTGEFKLLRLLGAIAPHWCSIEHLCQQVYGRGPEARPLVWKYVSTLRMKLSEHAPDLIEGSRRLGYRATRIVYIRGSVPEDLSPPPPSAA